MSGELKVSGERPLAHSKQGSEWLFFAGSAYPRETQSRTLGPTVMTTSVPTASRDPEVATRRAEARRHSKQGAEWADGNDCACPRYEQSAAPWPTLTAMSGAPDRAVAPEPAPDKGSRPA